MNNAFLLMEVDDLPMATDAPLGLLRYAAKKEKNRKFSRQINKSRDLGVVQAS